MKIKWVKRQNFKKRFKKNSVTPYYEGDVSGSVARAIIEKKQDGYHVYFVAKGHPKSAKTFKKPLHSLEEAKKFAGKNLPMYEKAAKKYLEKAAV